MLPVSSVTTLLWACVETATLWNVTAPRKYGQCLLPMVLPRVPEPHLVVQGDLLDILWPLRCLLANPDRILTLTPHQEHVFLLGKHLGYSVLWAAVLHRK